MSKKSPAKARSNKGPKQDEERAAPQTRRYQLTQTEYAKRYGKSLATIKRWWKQGKPLDDPDAMGEYLSPRGRKSDDNFESPSRIPPPDDSPDEGEIPIALDESFFAGEGILSAIERLKKAERERAAAYFDAIKRRLFPQILQNRFKEWTGIIETLRKVAKDEPEIRKANELTIDRAEVEAAIGQIFQSFRGAANNLPGRAASKLLGLREHGEILDVLEREIEVLLRSLADVTLDAVAQAEAAAARAETPEEKADA